MKAQQDAGFTLLELLVAMTLIGLLSLVLFTSATFGTRVWERTERATEGTNRLRAAEDFLTRKLEAAYPALILRQAAHGYVDFEGHADRISFLAPDDRVPGALARMTLETGDAPAGEALLYKSDLELARDPDPRTRVLLAGITSFSISYFGPGEDGGAPQWQDEWTMRPVLPALIRIRLTFSRKTAGVSPDIIIAPRIWASVPCIFDPLTKSCQGRR